MSYSSIMCKVRRWNSTKLEAIQATHHTLHATTYNNAMLEGAPVMVDKGGHAHHQHSYFECLCMCCLPNLVGAMAE